MRIRRTVLTVPGNNRKFIEKAAQSSADEVMLDLEDSVPVERKIDARGTIVKALGGLDWADKGRVVRINGLETPFAYRDIIEVIEGAGDKVDALVVPKVNNVSELHFVSMLLDQIEASLGFSRRIAIEASIETAGGLARIEEIASSSDRLEALVFGVADYTTSIGAKGGGLSGHGEDQGIYPGHRWHFPLSRMVMAAKAAGLMAIDAPYGNFHDQDGLKESALIAAALGCDGKWVIHPSQIDVCNAIFSPTAEEVERARRVLKAHQEGISKGRGAVSVDGRMIDKATLNLAKQIIKKAKRVGMIDKGIIEDI